MSKITRVPAQGVGDFADDHDLFQLADATDQRLLVGGRALYRDAQSELDPVKRAALFIRMNDLAVGDGYVLPIIARTSARALNQRLVAPLSCWQLDMSSLPHWYRET